MNDHVQLTPEEITLLADTTFFPTKAKISIKIRAILEQLHEVFQTELQGKCLILPDQCDLDDFQFVKGEHLEHFPYQYLDFPKYYTRHEKCSFRSLFWWGHHIAFALILEGGALRQYKENLINRYSTLSDRHLCLSLGSSLWEWNQGPGYTLDLTHERKPEVAAVLANRSFFKLTKFVPFHNTTFSHSTILDIGQDTFHTLLSVITK